MTLYYRDRAGRFYEHEADTAGGVWVWVRRLDTDESCRVKRAVLVPVSDAEMLAMARAEVAS